MTASGIAALASDVGDAFGRVNTPFVVLALVCQGGNLFFRALAWRNVLAAAYPGRRIPVLGIGAAYAAGVALNAFLPARGGEAAKVALVRLQLPGTSIAAIAAAGSVVLLFDALVGGTLLLGAWGLGALPAPPGVPAAASALAARPWLTLAVAVPGAVGLVWLTTARLGAPARRVWKQVARGGAVLRTPGRYFRTVVSMQVGAWACRIGTVLFLLAAFGLPASVELAALVVVLGGVSTLVPATPGGVGAQQALVVYGLSGAVSAAAALSFSIGMQVVVTATNAAIGIVAAMVIFRTFRPLAAVRAGVRAARG